MQDILERLERLEALILEIHEATVKPKRKVRETVDNNDTLDVRKQIVDYTNQKLKTNYRHTTKKLIDTINARLNEGYGFDDFKFVIDVKYNEWHKDEKMAKYLRYDTLFGNKFSIYRNQVKPQNTKNQIKELENLLEQKTKMIDGHIEKHNKGLI